MLGLSAAAVPVGAENLAERAELIGDAWGRREPLANRGLTVEATLTFDISANLRGGLDTGSLRGRHLLDVALTWDTQPMLGHPGGTIFARGQQHHGDDFSARHVGDLQAFSNLDADGRTQLAELWFEQRFADDRARLILGKVDANELFAFVDHGAEFIHSSAGFSPTILDFPTYPDPATSVNLFLQPGDAYLGVGVYDGALREGVPTGERGPATFFGEPADLFLIAEIGVHWRLHETRTGRIGVGVWRHTGAFERFDGRTENSTVGYYLVLDQALWQSGDGRDVGLFFQYGWADDAISEIEHHVGAGLAWTGPIPTRRHDVTGVMLSHAHLSGENGAGFTEEFELACEWFYKVQVTPWFSLKPDVQYIVNPGGDAALDDAVVFTLRGELVF